MNKMSIPNIDADGAAELLIDTFVRGAYIQSIRSIMGLLRADINLVTPPRRWARLQKWYAELTKVEQARVKEIVDEATYAGIFSVLAILDGESENPLPHTWTEMSVHLKAYVDAEAPHSQQPALSVEIKPSELSVGLLHDLFQEKVDESKRRQRSRQG